MAAVEAGDDHSEMQEMRNDAEQRRLLTAMPCGRRGEYGTHLAVESATRPQATLLIRKGCHLRRDATETLARTDDDCITVGQIIDRGDRRRFIRLEVVAFWRSPRERSRGTRLTSTSSPSRGYRPRTRTMVGMQDLEDRYLLAEAVPKRLYRCRKFGMPRSPVRRRRSP